jgi:hypothetical protein
MKKQTLQPTLLLVGLMMGSVACVTSAFPQTSGSTHEVSRGKSDPGPFLVPSVDTKNQSATIVDRSTGTKTTVAQNKSLGQWTLMAVLQEPAGGLAVLEDLGNPKGDILYVGKQGVVLRLAKSAEPTTAAPDTLYGGHSLEDVVKSKADLLSPALLAGKDDPTYDKVAAVLPPLRVPSFVGTPHGDDKPTFEYGGFSDEIYLDPGKLYPQIQEARNKKNVLEGLIGDWLPVVRFVFPTNHQAYWEESIFADVAPGNFWTQPTWFRVLSVDNGQLKEAHYFNQHLPFPPRGEPPASAFYKALLECHSVWQHDLDPPMKIDVPDQRILKFCLRSLSLQMITRVNNHPKYGYPPLGGINVFGGYGYNNVDTFQDTFNADVTAFLEWGLFSTARGYIDDYFTNTVRDDGSIDSRGPEIGEYGKMLTTMAKYYSFTKDDQLMSKYHKKLLAIVDLFYSLRKESKDRPTTDISYGIIRGWSEHDSSLKKDPYKFMLPHFANNGEAARGFHDLGNVWISIGSKTGNSSLQAEGRRMLQESEAMKKDMSVAIDKSIVWTQKPPYMPAVAGDTPTYGKSRAYVELLESGELNEGQTRLLEASLEATGNSVFGLPRGGTHITGFLDFGSAFARLDLDQVREFLLLYYAHMSHLYSPGTWTAVESARMDGTQGGPYCTPTQVTIPIFTKWLTVFEDPDQAVLWLAKATPRAWLAQGEKIEISNAPTRFGKVGYELQSDIDHGTVSAVLRLPEGYNAATKLRLRVPGEKRIRSVTVNGAPWSDYSAETETISIPPRFKGTVKVEASY